MAIQQAERPIKLKTPLGDDVLVFDRMWGREELGRPFRFELEMLSEDPAIVIDDILAHPVTVEFPVGDTIRYFNAYVTEFSQVGIREQHHLYRATLSPWLWFLTRTADCRILPDKSSAKTMNVPDIVKEVFREHGFSDIEDRLQETYKVREHCVQYRESDFDFISRLLEEEGIYYYFVHEDGKHTIVLCDAPSCHEPFSGFETIPYYPPDPSAQRSREGIHDWAFSRQVQTGIYALDDHDFIRPKADLSVKSSIPREHQKADYEVFDYPGEYVEPADEAGGDLGSAYEAYARHRIEEEHARFHVVRGRADARGILPGHLFALEGHPREDQNIEHLVVSVDHDLQAEAYRSDATPGQGPLYQCQFAVIDAQQPFRPQRITRKPVIQGPQTAVVVGASGKDIYTDQYGRVKLQFHWDRVGNSDENSSCWARVSQNWAGNGWGGMFVPHVGHEVIVEFLEGDPDRPIVTGRVYNADNMPPLKLPDCDHKSIIRDQFGNEIVFDATPGGEHIELHSPSHNSSLYLGKSVQWETKSDKNYFTNGNAHTNTIGATSSVFCGHDFSFKAAGSESVTIGAKADLFVGAAASVNVGYKFGVDVGGSFNLNYNYNYTYCKSKETKVNKADFVRASSSDIVHDSVKHVKMVGGSADNSIIDAAPTQIELRFGKGPDNGEIPQAVSGLQAFATTAAGLAAGIVAAGTGAAAGMVAAGAMWDEKKDSSGTHSESPIIDETWKSWAIAAGVTGATLLAGAAGMYKAMKSIMKVPENKAVLQTSTYSHIQLQEKQMNLLQNDSGGTLQSGIALRANGEGSYYAKGNMTIRAEGTLFLDAAEIIIEKNKMKTKNGNHVWQ